MSLVVGCVTKQPIFVARGRDEFGVGLIQFVPIGRLARLRTVSRRQSFSFGFRHECIVLSSATATRGSGIVTTGYAYTVQDNAGSEIVAYHWHPDGVSSVRHPHLHLSNQIRPIDLGRNQAPLPLADMHLATGVVPLAQLVRMLIEEFGVEPLRDDWDAVLPRS